MIVDAHLDLAYNAVRGRAVDRPAREQKKDDEGIPTVGLPDLRQGRVKLVCATIFCSPASGGKPGYVDAQQAHEQYQQQLDWYRRQEEKSGTIEFIRSSTAMQHFEQSTDSKTRAILLLEGADAIRHDGDAEAFFAAGVRIVGLAWQRTRYAGGTGAPGPLTDAGVRLVKTLDRLGIIHDASHLAEDSFWQLMDISGGPVIASHSNCRAIVPTDRQLSDRMIRAIALRGGVIGINFFDQFLLPPNQYGKRRATLADVAMHLKHICDCVGDALHVGLGTDMDGGLGRLQIPEEIETSADLPRVADALSAANFPDADIANILENNWLRYFREKLPRK